MLRDEHSARPAAAAGYRGLGLQDWSEGIVTAVAASLAVLIVAAVAVLMGMA